MKIRVTLMTENNVPVSELGEYPERKIRHAWDALIGILALYQNSDEEIWVEKTEIVDEGEVKK